MSEPLEVLTSFVKAFYQAEQAKRDATQSLERHESCIRGLGLWDCPLYSSPCTS